MLTRSRHPTAILCAIILASIACRGDATAPRGPRRVGVWDLYKSVRTRWYATQPGYGGACPTVTGGIVVFGTEDGQVIGRSRASGAEEWRAPINGKRYSIDAPLIAVDGVVVVLAGDLTSGVDASNGQLLWSYAAPPDSGGPFDYPPAPGYLAWNVAAADSHGVVYIPAWGGSVSAIGARSGQTRWIWQWQPDSSFGAGANAVAVAGDTIFVSIFENLNHNGTIRRGWLVGIDRKTGRSLTRTVLPFPLDPGGGRILVTPDVVVATNAGAGKLAAVNRWTAAIAWTFTPPDGAYRSSDGVGGDAQMIFQDGGNDHFYAIRPATGEQVWENDFYGSPPATPVASSRRVYESNGWALHIYDRLDGGVVAKVTQPGHPPLDPTAFIGCVTVAGSEVYATTDGGAWSFWEP